jgi:hypothetical protein
VSDPVKDGVLIIQMNDKIDAVIERAEEEDDGLESAEVDGRTIYSIDGGEVHAYVHRHESGRRTIVLSKRAEHVLNAIKVIEGDLPDLTDAREPAIRPEPAENAIAYLCAAGARWLPEGEHPASQIVRLADGVTAQLVETDGIVRAEVAFHADKSENAQNIVQIVEGVVALGKLLASQDDEELAALRPLINGLRAEAHNSGIRVSLSLPVETLIELAEMAKEHHGDREMDDDQDDDDDDQQQRPARRREGWDNRR